MLVNHTRPPLVVSRLAGDALISYGLRENFLHGQTLIKKIDRDYRENKALLESEAGIREQEIRAAIVEGLQVSSTSGQSG